LHKQGRLTGLDDSLSRAIVCFRKKGFGDGQASTSITCSPLDALLAEKKIHFLKFQQQTKLSMSQPYCFETASQSSSSLDEYVREAYAEN